MTMLRSFLLAALVLLGLCATASAQSFPGAYVGDCNVSFNGVLTCGSLQGVQPGNIFPLSLGTGLTSSGGKLNVGSLSFSSITGQATFAQLPTTNADSVIGNFTGVAAAPGQAAIGSCSGGSSALTYNTATHAFGCNSISGSGVAGYGITIVSNVVSAPLIAYVARPMFGGL